MAQGLDITCVGVLGFIAENDFFPFHVLGNSLGMGEQHSIGLPINRPIN